jgi:hypothetical protein
MEDKKTEFIGFRTTPKVKKFLENLAQKEDRTVSYAIHALLSSLLNKPPKQLPKTGK